MELLNEIFELIKLAWVPGVILWGILYAMTRWQQREAKKLMDDSQKTSHNTREMLLENQRTLNDIHDMRKGTKNPKPIIIDIPEGVDSMKWIINNHERIMSETGMQINECQCKKCRVKRQLGETEEFMMKCLAVVILFNEEGSDGIFDWCEKHDLEIYRYHVVFQALGEDRLVELIDGYLSYKKK